MLDAADRLITGAARWALVGLMFVMTAVIFIQVVLRYGFNSSIDWADEVSRLAFVWAVFLAIPVAIRERLHIGMELLVVRLPGSWRVPLARTMNGVAVALMLLLCQQSLLLARDQWDEKMATVNASAAWFVVAVAVGAAMSVLELLRLMWSGEDANPTGVVE